MVQRGNPTPFFPPDAVCPWARRMEGISMPDPQLILIVLLLAAAVMYGYFSQASAGAVSRYPDVEYRSLDLSHTTRPDRQRLRFARATRRGPWRQGELRGHHPMRARAA